MHLLFMLLTSGCPGENQREVSGENQFTKSGFGTDFTNAELTLRLRGELRSLETQLYLLIQGVHNGICTGWILTGQPINVNSEWSEQRITAVTDESQWTCLGSRHDRSDFYGRTPLKTVLSDVSADIPSGVVSAVMLHLRVLASAQEPETLTFMRADDQIVRHSEGSAVELRDGRLMLVWQEFRKGSKGDSDDYPARLVSKSSRDGGRTWTITGCGWKLHRDVVRELLELPVRTQWRVCRFSS